MTKPHIETVTVSVPLYQLMDIDPDMTLEFGCRLALESEGHRGGPHEPEEQNKWTLTDSPDVVYIPMSERSLRLVEFLESLASEKADRALKEERG